MTSSTPPSGRSVCTHDQIIAENAAITARNEACRDHRDRGKANVDNDKPLLPLPATTSVVFSNTNINHPSTPNATTSSSQLGGHPSTLQASIPNVSTMMAAFANLSPSKLTRLHASIFNLASTPSAPTPSAPTPSASTPSAFTPSAPTPPTATSNVISTITTSTMPAPSPSITSSSLLFDINNEHASSMSISNTYGVHTYIIELAKCHQHIPLSILTTKATSHLFLEPSTLKFLTHYTSHHNSVPTKCHILDVSQFPAETSISIGEWHKAWAHFLNYSLTMPPPKFLNDGPNITMNFNSTQTSKDTGWPSWHLTLNSMPHILLIPNHSTKLSTIVNLKALKPVSSGNSVLRKFEKPPSNLITSNPTLHAT
ncbi:uncharacterized protein BJ212DRAFT_1483788 [Suillus subaureus]|uniref:Uncharacterized protein n=1 Tax=Suillus subaureus TaxID=48587 RepID=A0A9P7E4K4_9AGAM|nr:uncharacterized protein BJ212DRAFT_1483788 [Suillus subaureus]KAG1811117.1 hypothetical protein BJ212DRAFT_1483788 [Suillus subaureus]